MVLGTLLIISSLSTYTFLTSIGLHFHPFLSIVTKTIFNVSPEQFSSSLTFISLSLSLNPLANNLAIRLLLFLLQFLLLSVFCYHLLNIFLNYFIYSIFFPTLQPFFLFLVVHLQFHLHIWPTMSPPSLLFFENFYILSNNSIISPVFKFCML